MNAALTAGFADPVGGTQACFRAVLDAMARPGRIHAVTGVTAPPPLCDAAGAVLLTLIDHETPLWLDPAAGAAELWIGFHTGAPIVAPARAMFAMALSMAGPMADFAELPAGSDETPETAATMILQVAGFGTGRRYELDGPGLRQPAILAVDGLPGDFAATWQRNRARFPLGVDLILCAGHRVAALPRGISVREA